ncbi:MAG: Ig-like domain-containing protein [Candidatus Eisenbacteria bacterium]
MSPIPHSIRRARSRSRVPFPRALPALAMLCGLCGPGCSPPEEPRDGTDTAGPEVKILQPLSQATVADTVLVEIEARDSSGIARVVLLADGSIIDERFLEPWSMRWVTDGIPDSSRCVLMVLATDLSGNCSRSAECPVWVRANEPPVAEVLWPRQSAWIDLERPPGTWRCRALDPEEGDLPPERVHWFLDGSPLQPTGCEVPAPVLAPGEHRLRIEVRDGWGARAAAECRLTAFRYPDPLEPVDALVAFLHALQAGDAEKAVSALRDDAVFHAPGAPAGMALDHAMVAEAFASLLDPSSFWSVRIATDCGRIERGAWRGTEIAKIELHDLEISVVLSCPGNDFNQTSQVTWKIGPSPARLILAPAPAGGTAEGWRILGWWDLQGAVWTRDAGPSWTDLILAAAAGRLCRP